MLQYTHPRPHSYDSEGRVRERLYLKFFFSFMVLVTRSGYLGSTTVSITWMTSLTVNGPAPFKVSTKSAALTALTRVVNDPAPTAVSTMSLLGAHFMIAHVEYTVEDHARE